MMETAISFHILGTLKVCIFRMAHAVSGVTEV